MSTNKLTNNNVQLPTDIPDEQWVPYEGCYVSDHGRLISSTGKQLTVSTSGSNEGRCKIGNTQPCITTVMAKAFKIKDYEKLGGQKSQYVVRKSSNTTTFPPKLQDIYVGRRADVSSENGQNSRKTENFQEAMDTNIDDKFAQNIEYKFVHEFNVLVFADGSIYSCQAKRFLSGSLQTSSTSKNYKQICFNDKNNVYFHRLVCFAFFPLDGKSKYDNYNDLQVNHKDGNTMNNHKDNLEWVSASDNMQHAYNTDLNKKVQTVLQFVKLENGCKGELIKEHKSIASAVRETNIPEHVIRKSCQDSILIDTSKPYNQSEVHAYNKNMENYKYIWEYKDTQKALEFSQKFSVWKPQEQSLQTMIKQAQTQAPNDNFKGWCFNKDIQEHEGDINTVTNKQEVWRRLDKGWISNHGRALSCQGKLLVLPKSCFYRINGDNQDHIHIVECLARAFGIIGLDLKTHNTRRWHVRQIDPKLGWYINNLIYDPPKNARRKHIYDNEDTDILSKTQPSSSTSSVESSAESSVESSIESSVDSSVKFVPVSELSKHVISSEEKNGAETQKEHTFKALTTKKPNKKRTIQSSTSDLASNYPQVKRLSPSKPT